MQPLDAPEAAPGSPFGPIEFTVSPAANDRYWGSAGVDHVLMRDGYLYPPMAANFTILAFQTIVPAHFLHTGQRLECHGKVPASADVTVTGIVLDRIEKRNRNYVEIRADIGRDTGEPLWTSIATFCDPQARSTDGSDRPRPPKPARTKGPQSVSDSNAATVGADEQFLTRSLHMTAELLRAYSRRGNFHSDADAAADLGYQKLVAQGMQSAGPAYGLLLDAWGDDFLTNGLTELRFVGMVVEDDTVNAQVVISAAGNSADIVVTNETTGVPVVVGSAQRSRMDT